MVLLAVQSRNMQNTLCGLRNMTLSTVTCLAVQRRLECLAVTKYSMAWNRKA